MVFVKIPRYISVQTGIAVCLNICELINGYGVGLTAPMIPKLQDYAQTPLPSLVTTTEASWIAGFVYFGIFGAYICSYLSNVFGRRRCLIICGVVFTFAYVLLTVAQNLAMLFVGRLLAGVGMSWSTVGILIYIGEIASPNIRGIILTSTGVFHALGALLVYCVGPFLTYAGLGYVGIALGVAFTVICFFIPESPVYHVIKGNEEAAKNVLRHLGRSEDINSELNKMIEHVKECEANKLAWREVFALKSNRKALFITVLLYIFQQASGLVTVLFFATNIFKSAGSSVLPDIATMIVGATLLFGTIVSPMFIEKHGRRALLIISTIGCCLSLAVLGVYFYLDVIDHPSITALGWLPLLCLVLSLFSYSVGLSTIPNALAGEMFSPKVRGVGNSISLTAGWISGLIWSLAFGYVVVALGSHVTFWLFAAMNALALVFVIIFVPETKGKSLMEIEAMLAK